MEDDLLTPEQAAELLQMAPITLAIWRSQRIGDLPYIKLSSKAIRYRRSDIEAWLARRTVTPGGPGAP